ncbi:MAG: T9SS type A sorting domain-containing protein, partial [Ignavibacteriaceae bacterium]
GQNVQNTFIGFGTNNLPVTAGVRFTASEDMQLANIDALYRSELNSDSVLIRVWAAGTTTTAPGELLYSKNFAGINYIVPGEGGAYITLPLGEDAPAFLTGSDFWVSITFSSEIQYPMGAHNSPLTNPGRSFISGDDGVSWSPLVITTERAWLLRVVGIPYEEPIPPYLTLWERSDANSTMPSWFGATTERGISYGVTSDGNRANNSRLFVVSRSSGIAVKILDAETGVDIGDLNTTGIAGGLLPLNDVGVTTDGKILACNVATSGFTVYMWDNETSVPTVALTYNSANRIGDKFTVVGDFAAGTAQIWAASATTGVPLVYKWTMSGGTFDPTPLVITLSDNVAGGIASASVGPLANGDFYWNATGQNARKYQADGTLIGIIPTLVVPVGSNAIRYLGTEGPDEYVATYAFGADNENLRIMEVPAGNPVDAVLYAVTPSLGTNSASGNGDVTFKINSDYTANVFVLSANNGIGAYRTTSTVPVELTNFAVNVVDRNVTLNWSTASETNSMGFEVERKLSNDFLWEKIGFIRSAGNTTQTQNYTYVDSKLESGTFEYRLKMIDFDGSFSYSIIVEAEIGTPMTFALSQNYPNPFNPSTRIDYQVPFNANVQIELYSITGERVATLVNTELSAGFYSTEIDAAALRLASGVYLYRMISTDIQGSKFVDTKKMVLLK